MVEGFDANDDFRQLGIMEANMLDQFGLCVRRSGNEDGAGVRNRFSDRLKVLMIRRGVPASDGICLVMEMPGWMIRAKYETFNVCRAEMEYPRFAMINPDDGMIMMLIHEKRSFLAT
jgi:hypothetical protein